MAGIALQIQNPQFDVAGNVRQGMAVNADKQVLQGNQQTNQLNALNLKEKTGEQNALDAYRTSAATGDPKDLSPLKAYPEIQATIFKALDSMKPDQVAASGVKADAFGTAAQYVLSFPPGSPEQKTAWNKVIDDLQKNGSIDGAQASTWKANGPSDVLLQQALSVKDAVAAYTKQATTKNLSTADLLDVETKVNEFARNYYPSGKLTVSPQEIATRDKATADYRESLMARLTGAQTQTPAAAPAGSATPAAGGNTVPTAPVLGGAGGGNAFAPRAPVLGQNLPATTFIPPGMAQPQPTAVARPLPPTATGAVIPSLAPPPTTLKDWKPGLPVPATHANAVKITGTVEEQRAQLAKLPSGTPIIKPDGTPSYRK